jgi:hypothetical protein
MSNESENEEYSRYCVINYKPSIQNAYKEWANTDEDFLVPDYELVVWDGGNHQHLSLNRRKGKWYWMFMGGSELYDFYYSLWEHIEDAPSEITEEIVGLFDRIFTLPRIAMEPDPFTAFV